MVTRYGDSPAQPPAPGWLERLALAALLLALPTFLAVRWSTLGADQLNIDEAHFAGCAARLVADGGAALLNCRDNKPPGIFWFYELAFRWAQPFDMSAVRALFVCWLGMAAWLCQQAAAGLAGRAAGWLAAALFLIAVSVDAPVIAAKTEALAAVPLGAGALLLVRAARGDPAPGACFAFGVAVAIAALCKQPTALALGAVVMVAGPDRWRWAQGVLAAVAGFGAVLGGLLVVYGLLDGVEQLVWQSFTSPLQYAALERVPLWRRLARIATYSEEYGRILPLLSAGVVAGLAAGAALLLRSGWRARPSDRAWLAICALLVLTYLAALTGADLYQAYFVMMLPAACVLAGAALVRLLAGIQAPERGALAGASAVVALGVAGGCLLSLKEPIKTWQAGQSPAAREIVRAIVQGSSPADRIYVWGYSPDLYLQARRVPASRYANGFLLVGFQGEGARKVDPATRIAMAEPGAMDGLLRELAQAPPALFIDAAQTPEFGAGSFAVSGYPRLAAWLGEHYTLVGVYTEQAGTRVFRLWRHVAKGAHRA